MRHSLFATFSLALVLPVLGPFLHAQEDTSQAAPQDSAALQVMSLQDVIDLSKAGVGDGVIIDQMKATQSVFELTRKDIIDLKNAGVSDRVISAMIGTTYSSREAGAHRASSYGYTAYPYYPPFVFGLGFGYFWPRLYHHHGFPVGFVGRGYRGGYSHGGFGMRGHRGFGTHR